MEYIIAHIRLSLPDALVRGHFANALAPFAATCSDHTILKGAASDETIRHRTDTGWSLSSVSDLSLDAAGQIPEFPGYEELCRFDFADADAECRFGRDEAGYRLDMTPRNGGAPACFSMEFGTTHALCNLTKRHNPALLRFGVWMLFNIAALSQATVALHASAVRYRDGGVLFLGESGTGKSTHARLWVENIAGAELLNDDSPFVRAADGTIRVYGSPWSGKTPCYRNESSPVVAIVRLVQSAQNRMQRLRPIEAIGAMIPSVSPALTCDADLQEEICSLLSQAIAHVPLYRLECRPDADAARLSCMTIFNLSDL